MVMKHGLIARTKYNHKFFYQRRDFSKLSFFFPFVLTNQENVLKETLSENYIYEIWKSCLFPTPPIDVTL